MDLEEGCPAVCFNAVFIYSLKETEENDALLSAQPMATQVVVGLTKILYNLTRSVLRKRYLGLNLFAV
jgi:hypothetical protein